MLLPSTTEDWARVLMELGVEHQLAQERAPSFAQVLHEGAFSAGLERELPDFLVTILHESAMLERLKESGKYSARRIREISSTSAPGSRWRSLLPRAEKLAYDPKRPATEDAFFEALYGGRMGNGPEGSGDGARYPGRAYIGVTGLDNYRWLTDYMGLNDLVVNPTLLEEPIFGLEITLAWWEGKVPDHILGDERKVRKVVNGGYIGLPEVERLAKLVRGCLQCSA